MVAGPTGYCSTEDIMHTYDFTPLFRSTIGFDRLSRLMDAALQANGADAAYPPYNIESAGEDAYRITLAVAGFGKDDIEITVTEDTLVVKGGTVDRDDDVTYLHRLREALDAMLAREGRAELAAACFAFLPTRAMLDLGGWNGIDVFAHH